MKTQKFLTQKVVNSNTNNLYFKKSHQTNRKLLILAIFIFLVSIPCISVDIDTTRKIYVLFFILIIYILFLIKMTIRINHLFPKKRFEFMNYLNEYNLNVKLKIATALQKGEEIIFLIGNEKDQKLLFESISSAKKDYSWLDDPIKIDTSTPVLSLIENYYEILISIRDISNKIGIKIKSLEEINLENLQNKGLKLDNEETFFIVHDLIQKRSEWRDCFQKLWLNLAQRDLLQDEISEYFTKNTKIKTLREVLPTFH